MKFRPFPNTDLRVSEVGLGAWTVSMGCWGEYGDRETVSLRAVDFGLDEQPPVDKGTMEAVSFYTR